MNIIIIPSWYKTKSNKIRGSFFLEQAMALKAKGHKVVLIDVELLSVKATFKEGFFTDINHYFENDVEIFSWKGCAFGLARIPNLFLKIVRHKIDFIIKKKINFKRIDIIHAHSFYPAGVVAIDLAKKYNAKVFLTEHFSGIITGNMDLRKAPYLSYVVENVNGVACVSKNLANKIKEKTNTLKDIAVIPNILNPIFNFRERQEKKEFVFILIGRLIKLKRINCVIAGIKKMKDKQYPFKLLILGEGPERVNLEQQIKELNLEKEVSLLGNVSREQVSEYIAYSDVFILPSVIETFGVVYIESLAIGRPVIATLNGGANEIIDNSNGILIAVNSQEQLEQAMEDIYMNYYNYDLRGISSECIKKYNQEAVYEKILDFYKN